MNRISKLLSDRDIVLDVPATSKKRLLEHAALLFENESLLPVDHAKIAVKLTVAVIVAVLVFANRKRDVLSTGAWALIGGLTIANIVVAVFWR